MNKENIACTYNGILCILKKEGNCAIRNNMDDPRECYAEWNKPGNTGETLNDFTYMLESKTVEFTEADNRMVVDGAGGWTGMLLVLGYKISASQVTQW